MTEADARRVIVAELTARLRPVCTQWPHELFTAMVERLADITLKYDRGFATPSYDRRSTERLVADLRSALERSKASRSGDLAGDVAGDLADPSDASRGAGPSIPEGEPRSD
jgi:hypothetical protein